MVRKSILAAVAFAVIMTAGVYAQTAIVPAKPVVPDVGGGYVVPIVPAAVLFDPGRFGRAFTDRPDDSFGRKACDNASAGPIKMGNYGAGAVAGGIKGGLGTASVDLGSGVIVGAIVAVNAGGSAVNPATGEFYAKYLEVNGEFGNLRASFASIPAIGTAFSMADMEAVKNTTIACIATNVKLTKAQARKIAEMAHDGMARAIIRAILNAETAGTTASYKDKYPTAFSR